MFEVDIVSYQYLYKLPNCPKCGLMLEMYPFEMSNFKHGIGKIVNVGRHSSYRKLLCPQQHMFVITGKYISTFNYSDRETWSLRRFEICCDDDYNWEKALHHTSNYFHKYSISDRIRLRMTNSIKGSDIWDDTQEM
jgi:hypothetical protein